MITATRLHMTTVTCLHSDHSHTPSQGSQPHTFTGIAATRLHMITATRLHMITATRLHMITATCLHSYHSHTPSHDHMRIPCQSQCRGHRFDPWSGKVSQATGQLSQHATTGESPRAAVKTQWSQKQVNTYFQIA